MILVTSCPECKTTFRISVGTLEKAGGQVRCGRCARIFDANAKLREVEESEVEARPASAFKFELQPDPEADSPAEAPEFDDELPTPKEPSRALSGNDDAQPAEDDARVAEDDDAQAAEEDDEPAAEDDDAQAVRDDDAPVAEPEHIVLETLPLSGQAQRADESAEEHEPSAMPDWLLADSERQAPRTRLWAAGVALATLALVGQLVHRYREQLVGQPAIGPVLAFAYSGFGTELRAAVALDQYELRDLTAVAEPSSEDQGWLVIETRVHNGGPKVQPYPHIFVRLLDRWEDTVAARYFAPQEYAMTSIPDVDRMNVGSTIDAQFIIMDPGPSATGFELELCIESTRGFECESDIVDE